jgi:predicted DNA-binding transcriptional regulator AlpA
MNFGLYEEPDMPIATTTLEPVQPSRAPDARPPTLPDVGFVREARLLVFLPFSHSTLWRRVAAGSFPMPVKLSERITAWRVEDIRTWIEAQGASGSSACG